MLKRKSNIDMDEEGVSEVLGTILTLLITVALFGSVFATVTQMEGPEGEINVDLDAYFEYQDGEDSVIITHEGGESLDTDSLSFFLLIDDMSHRESPIENEASWSIGKERTLRGNWDIDSDSNIELMIRHDDTNRVIYETMLLEEGRNIVDIRNSRIEYEHDWRDYAEPNENITIKTQIAAPIWMSNQSFEPEEDMWINASISEDGILADENEDLELDHSHSNRFEKTVQIDGAAEDDRYRVKITAEHREMDLDIDPDYIYLNIGQEPVRYYEEELVIGRVWFEPGSPSHGDDFTIYADVFNEGEVDQEAEWAIKDDRQGEFNSTELTTISHGAAPTEVSASYPEGIKGHGPHEITFEVVPDDDEWDGDEWRDTIYVDPNIMLVRDHLHEGLREGELMDNALKGLNLEPDMYSVEPDEEIENLEETLAQYSVAIWMTGNKTNEDPYLADGDVSDSLTKYIEGELDDSEMNGSLWIIGSNLDEISFDSGELDLDEKLGIDSNSFGSHGEFSEEILANPEYDENGTYGDFEYDVSRGEYVEIEDLEDDDDIDENNTLVQKDSTEKHFGVGYEAAEKERTAVNSFLFESIADPGQQTTMAGEVVQWLSNMTTRTGVDVAVTSQTIEPTAPMFMDEVRINATLRNNGPEDLHVPVRAERNGGEEVLSPDGDNQVYLQRDGGTNTTSFTWEADELGRHEIIVKADYFNQIDEVTRENNDVESYKDLDVTDDNIEVNVHFSTLLVDAEEYDGNNPDENVTREIEESFNNLGHREGIDYDYHHVGEDGGGPGQGTMEDYNAIYWVTGENEEIFTGEIENYLEEEESGANVMFIGEHILDGVSEGLLKNMGIADVRDREKTDTLMGQEDHNLGHGLRYDVEDREYRTFGETSKDGEVLFQSEDGELNFASTYDDGTIKTVYMGVNPTSIEGPLVEDEDFDDWPAGEVNTSSESAREEFVYTSLWYFGKRDDRSELRVTDYDISPSSDHPHTGRSYQLDARIENIGYSSASALIRFKDGRDRVASQTIHIEGSSRTSEEGSSYFEVTPGSTTAEVSWTPDYGGIRPIGVRVDPIGRTDEIEDDDGNKMMEFNNQAILEHPVYYFYDDMESDNDYWERQATIANIDGEAPIDYLGDEEDLDTDVIGDWDWDKTNDSVEKVSDYSRSDPNSYFMEEPEGPIGLKADALISIVIDNSFSMGDRTYQGETWLWHAKEAAKFLVEDLSNESMVGLWNYDGTNPERITEPLQMEEHRDDVLDYIDDIESNPQAPVWDSVGGAYEDVRDYRENNSHLEPAVILLTDGADKHASDVAANRDDFETGSEEWAPWHKMENEDGTPNVDYDDSHIGKYRFDYRDDPDPYEAGVWEAVPPHHQHAPGERKGLLNSSFPMFSIGLGLEHNPDVEQNPEDPDWNPAPDLDSADDDNYLIQKDEGDERTWEAGTMEYNLWRIADTSDGRYFYAPDPGQLESILYQIGTLLTGPQNLTSVDDPTPLDSSSEELTFEEDDEINFDKYAVTPELDLSNTSSAWLTFWHRYRLLQGVNGAYLEIGYEDDNGNMNWHYIEPSIGPYTGNLLEGEEPTDDRDKLIEWAWNGKSGDGTMDWDRVSIDLLRDDYEIPEEHLDSVRLRFYYQQFGGSNVPGGWWIDDVRVDVTRSGDWWDDDIEGDMHDMWQLKETKDMDGEGTTAWWNGMYGEDRFKGGIDNSLITDPIDLRHAQSATFSGEFKFNINEEDVMPPDGFRVEVSQDEGRTWSSINLGLRAATGISGNESTNHWTTAENMTRLNIDLSDYSGNIIMLRFRVVTNNNIENFEVDPDDPDSDIDFGGLYINNVMVVDDELRE